MKTAITTKEQQVLTPRLIEAIKCWILSELYMNNERIVNDERWQKGYEAECRLFNELFCVFTDQEKETYKEFVQWLNDTQMWHSDLTIEELFNTYKSK